MCKDNIAASARGISPHRERAGGSFGLTHRSNIRIECQKRQGNVEAILIGTFNSYRKTFSLDTVGI
jgi:hypothetical protein